MRAINTTHRYGTKDPFIAATLDAQAERAAVVSYEEQQERVARRLGILRAMVVSLADDLEQIVFHLDQVQADLELENNPR